MFRFFRRRAVRDVSPYSAVVGLIASTKDRCADDARIGVRAIYPERDRWKLRLRNPRVIQRRRSA